MTDEKKDMSDLAKDIYAWAKEKGWWDGWRADPEQIAAKLALIHSEVSEGLEEVRVGRLNKEVIDGKPEGLETELADVIIRVLDLAEVLGMDMQAAVIEKMAYNHTRAHRHGNKAL